MKKILSVLLAVLLLSGCAPQNNESDKVKIVTTLFPQYDFAREIGGAYAEVSLLLPPGVESHTFEPSPADIININKQEFIYYATSIKG